MPGERLPAFVRLAASTGVRTLVESYVRKGYDVNATDSKQRTLLLLAAARGHADICRLLIDVGADPALRDAKGDDALSVAVRNRRTETAALLRACSPPPRSGNSDPGTSSSRDVVAPDGIAPSPQGDQYLDQWDELAEPPPPADSPLLRMHAIRLQNRISEHVPIDRNTAWSDVEIELPEAATRHDPDRSAWLDGVRCLIDFGLSWGRVTPSQVAEVAARGEGRDSGDEIEARLRLVLGDMGIPVEEDLILESIANQSFSHDPSSTDGHGGIVDEAISFLDDLSLAKDPRTYYWKDATRRDLLSKDEEVALAIRIENASKEILGAISRCPGAMKIVLEWAEQSASESDEFDDGPRRGREIQTEPDMDLSSGLAQLCGSDWTAFRKGLHTIRRLVDSASPSDPTGDVRDALITLDLSDVAVRTLVEAVVNDTTQADAAGMLESAMRKKVQAYVTFAETNLRLVAWCATKHGGIPFMDRVQEGNIGLLKAIERFDHRQGAKFSTYATMVDPSEDLPCCCGQRTNDPTAGPHD